MARKFRKRIRAVQRFKRIPKNATRKIALLASKVVELEMVELQCSFIPESFDVEDRLYFINYWLGCGSKLYVDLLDNRAMLVRDEDCWVNIILSDTRGLA